MGAHGIIKIRIGEGGWETDKNYYTFKPFHFLIRKDRHVLRHYYTANPYIINTEFGWFLNVLVSSYLVNFFFFFFFVLPAAVCQTVRPDATM